MEKRTSGLSINGRPKCCVAILQNKEKENMAIFGKNKKNLKSLLKAISTLSDEEREELMNELFADDATEEGKNAEAQKPTEGATQPADNAQENANVEADKPTEGNATPPAQEQPTQEVAPQNDYAKEFAILSEMLQALNTRFDEMDKKVAGYDERLSAYDTYVAQKKESIGAEQQIPGAKKDINDMTAEELAKSIRQGI